MHETKINAPVGMFATYTNPDNIKEAWQDIVKEPKILNRDLRQSSKS